MAAPITEVRLSEYTSIGRVLFGPGAADQVGEEAAQLVNGRRCLLVTDPGIVRAGLLERIVSSLRREAFDLVVCDQVRPEPTLSIYQAVLETAGESTPDLLVAVGGGSSLDVAKAVARALTNPQSLEAYLGQEFERDGLPLITIPTTSGTGAEVTPDAIVLLPEEKIKSGFYNARASVAVIDPTLMLSLPPGLTAATGVDALSHAVESALSRTATPLTQALALESIRIISENLKSATHEGDNLAARTQLAWATLLAALSESNAGDVEGHAVAHVLGGYYRIHHGRACAIALPYCMDYNLAVNTPILARIAQAMDLRITGTRQIMARQGIRSVCELIRDVGVSTSIADIEGASTSHIPELVKLYCGHPDIVEILRLFARRGVPSEAAATQFFRQMFAPLALD